MSLGAATAIPAAFTMAALGGPAAATQRIWRLPAALVMLAWLCVVAGCAGTRPAELSESQLMERSAWIQQIHARIMGNVLTPPATPPVAVTFSVEQSPSGDVTSVVRTNSSGFPDFDRAVEEAIMRSSPLPVVPAPELFLPHLELTFRRDPSEYHVERLERRLEEECRRIGGCRRKHVGVNAGKYQSYVDACLQRILETANRFYPDAARGRLYGTLLASFSIHASGELGEVEIIRSSGHEILDDAILEAITRSAPFPPFPPDVAQEADVLTIGRTYAFVKGEGEREPDIRGRDADRP